VPAKSTVAGTLAALVEPPPITDADFESDKHAWVVRPVDGAGEHLCRQCLMRMSIIRRNLTSESESVEQCGARRSSSSARRREQSGTRVESVRCCGSTDRAHVGV
jgi:hypothetical protein